MKLSTFTGSVALAAAADVITKGPLRGWTRDGRGGYLIGPSSKGEHKNFFDAYNHCKSMGASLATIKDEEYNALVAKIGADSAHGGTKDTWINGYRHSSGNNNI